MANQTEKTPAEEQLQRLIDDSEEVIEEVGCEHKTLDECCNRCHLKYEIMRAREVLNGGK